MSEVRGLKVCLTLLLSIFCVAAGTSDENRTACAREVLQHKWVFVLGDSSLRMLFAALVRNVNGSSLADPRFGSYKVHDKGGCVGDQEKQGHVGTSCLREFFDVERGIRLTFSFKTFVSQRSQSLEELVSASQVPDYFLLATGPWDFAYNATAVPMATLARDAMTWALAIKARFPSAAVVFADVVQCHYKTLTRARSVEYNKGIWALCEGIAPTTLRCLDRASSTNFVGSRKDSLPGNEVACSGFHAFGDLALQHLDRALDLFAPAEFGRSPSCSAP